MENVEIARKIVLGYINYSQLDYEEKLSEIAAINIYNNYLLEHINVMLDILTKAKQELEGEDGK